MTLILIFVVIAVVGIAAGFALKGHKSSEGSASASFTPPATPHTVSIGLEREQDESSTKQRTAQDPTSVHGPMPSQGPRAEARVPHPTKVRRAPVFEVPELFAVIDLETTGFSAGMDEIIEIGALKCAGLLGEVREFTTLVKPTRLIPPGITAKTGITQEMIDRFGVPVAEGVQQLQAFISDLPSIGYQVDFDMRFLKCTADQLSRPFCNPYVDVMEMAREAYPHLPSHKLDNVARMLNLSEEDAHRALADCHRTLAVFRHIVEKVDARQYRWNRLEDLPVIEPNRPRSPRYEQVLNHIGTHYSVQQGDANGHLRGETVVFTGDLSISRPKAIEMAVAAGCNVHPNVNRKTTIVVTGSRDPSLYNGKTKSGKLEKAEELISEGLPIRLLTENEFLALLQRPVSTA